MSNQPVRRGKTACLLLGLFVTAGLSSAVSVWAAPTNVTAKRSVVVGDRNGGNTWGLSSPFEFNGEFVDSVKRDVGGTHPYPGYPDFTTKEVAFAEQASEVMPSAGSFAGRGGVGIGYSVVDADLGYARSSFDAWFDIASPHKYTLTGTLGAFMDGGLGRASVSLSGPTSFAYAKEGWAEGILAEDGTLLPGSYHLAISASIRPQCEPSDCTQFSWMGGASSFDVGFQVTAVPEPGTYAMLLAGLSLIGFVARRRST